MTVGCSWGRGWIRASPTPTTPPWVRLSSSFSSSYLLILHCLLYLGLYQSEKRPVALRLIAYFIYILHQPLFFVRFLRYEILCMCVCLEVPAFSSVRKHVWLYTRSPRQIVFCVFSFVFFFCFVFLSRQADILLQKCFPSLLINSSVMNRDPQWIIGRETRKLNNCYCCDNRRSADNYIC